MKTIKHIQSLLVIIIACMTFGSCSNELNVTKSFPFTIETMPVPKELSQGETIEIRCTSERGLRAVSPDCSTSVSTPEATACDAARSSSAADRL